MAASVTEKTSRVKIKKVKHLLAFVGLHWVDRPIRVVMALVQTISSELLVARDTMKLNYTGKELPEEVSPGCLSCA